MVSTAAAERFLATPLLTELDSATRQALLNVLVEERAETGTTLLRQGQPNDHIAFLIDGTATVFRTRPDGRVETLTTLTAPSLFGLTSFFRPIPPGFSVRATSPVWLLTFDHDAHEVLRRVDLRAAEQLALAALRVMADRFDMLDRRVSDDMDQHPEDHPTSTEWANFRSRLFEESNL
jgi:CRP/FNR family transcriptional regulator, cyclic AMP receptor protein